MRFLNSRTLRYFGQRARELAHNFENAHHPYEERQGGRSWEDYYRRRWQHDKVVRSTHGVNCTGSCSFDVFVKDGIIVWEAQKTDYPTPHPDFPDYEPRGCPRGVSASWYVYSPLRVKYPYIRGKLLFQVGQLFHGGAEGGQVPASGGAIDDAANEPFHVSKAGHSGDEFLPADGVIHQRSHGAAAAVNIRHGQEGAF